MDYGILDLHRFMDPAAMPRLHRLFYIYRKLYAYNHGRVSRLVESSNDPAQHHHIGALQLLHDQDLVQKLDPVALMKWPVAADQLGDTYEELRRAMDYVATVQYERHGVSTVMFWDSLHDELWHERSNVSFANEELRRSAIGPDVPSHVTLPSVWERLFSYFHFLHYDQWLSPTSADSYGLGIKPLREEEVLRVVVEKVPIPDGSIPLADIIQFRDEEVNELRFRRLRSWVRKLSREGLSSGEIEEEVETLMMEYQYEMKLAGMAYKEERLEVLVKVPPSLLEDLLKLNFSKLVDPFFSLRRARLALLRAEQEAKGNEIAYLLNI